MFSTPRLKRLGFSVSRRGRSRGLPLASASLILATLVPFAACQRTDEGLEPPKPPNRVPTSGRVLLAGKPLAGAVVTFNPTDEKGTLTVSDTDENGRYDLTYLSFPGGTAPGAYRVAVSYMKSASGKVVSLGMRSSLAPSPETITARELLPEKYSNLGQTILSATVPEAGGTFDFELDGALIPYPTTEPPPASPPSGESSEPKSQEEPARKAQAAEPAQPNQSKGSESEPAPSKPGEGKTP